MTNKELKSAERIYRIAGVEASPFLYKFFNLEPDQPPVKPAEEKQNDHS